MATATTATTSQNAKSNSLYWVAGILAVIIVIALAGWLLLGALTDNNTNSGKPPSNASTSQSQPDRAKQEGGANGDTSPSPSGTGTGSSDNSILGQ